jgi:hypothetical protein
VFTGVARLGVVFATAIGFSAAPAFAGVESLKLVLGDKAELGTPYAITAEGLADSAHHLYVYVDAGGAGCAADPSTEAAEVSGATALSAAGGDVVGSGDFTQGYTFTPPAVNGYSVCAYLDESFEGSPDASAHAGFAAPGGPVEAPYLFNPQLQEQLKRIAVAREQQELQERERLRNESEGRERTPASALAPAPETPPVQVVPGLGAHCIVPRLKGHSLNGARHLLRRAHCVLGSVRRQRDARGPLVVTRQRVRHGTTLRLGAAIAVVLGPAKH